jgi:antitoxin ParD1/3/4
MPKRQVTRNVALTPHFDHYVQSKVRSGRYGSASEVVREGLRLMEQRDRVLARQAAGLRDAIEVGWEQLERGEVVDGPAVFAEIRRMSRARRAKRGARH